LVHVCAGLELAPTIADIGETASGLRVMKEISEEVGLLAERLIAAGASS
jgi:hypothetical protein